MWFDINKYVQSIDYFLEHVAMALMGEWPPRYPEVGGSNLGAGNLKSCYLDKKSMHAHKNQRSREIQRD